MSENISGNMTDQELKALRELHGVDDDPPAVASEPADDVGGKNGFVKVMPLAEYEALQRQLATSEERERVLRDFVKHVATIQPNKTLGGLEVALDLGEAARNVLDRPPLPPAPPAPPAVDDVGAAYPEPASANMDSFDFAIAHIYAELMLKQYAADHSIREDVRVIEAYRDELQAERDDLRRQLAGRKGAQEGTNEQ